MPKINSARLMADLRALAQFGKVGTGVDRTSFSPPDLAARAWLRDRMVEAGLDVRIDRVGNVYGRTPGVERAVLIGSHTDSVPRGGWLDGAMGVLYGLEIARAFRESGQINIGVDVISFQDEEGTFLPCVGSRSFCGDIQEPEIAAAKAKDGTALSAAMAKADYTGAPALLEPDRHVAYLEAHIEQGPRLEASGQRIGVVTGIVGIRRLRIVARGQADHAGTTPIAMRKDAGATLLQLANRILTEFPRRGGPDTVWNIGSIGFRPGAANVVPSEGEMVLEFRDVELARLDELETHVMGWIDEAGRGPVKIEVQPIARIRPTTMSPDIGKLIDAAARDRKEDPMWMPSGAGHDAMVLGRFIPAAMLFVPSIGGRSHDIVEDTAEADIVLGCDVLADTVAKLAERNSK
jgi:N-carbamoyl-L-amino-acid hydrolase